MDKLKNITNVLFVIIGTTVGARFASGKEIYNFFVRFGSSGILGIIISGILTGVIIYSVIKIVSREKILDNTEFIDKIHGNKVLYYIINIFLLASFYIMIAGFTTFFKQEYSIATYIISPFFCLVLYIILINKVEWIIKTNTIVVPILIIIMFFICAKYNNMKILTVNIKNMQTSKTIVNTIINAILYSSYNSIILIPMIITLTKYIKTTNENIILSITVTLIVILLAFGVYGVLINRNNIQNIEMPIILFLQTKIEKILYAVAIEIAIFTSAISAGYGILENLNKTICNNFYYKVIVAIMCILGVPISIIGFGNLVNIIYPMFGVLGIIQIILILKNNIEKKSNN